jgi:hypothetical protein
VLSFVFDETDCQVFEAYSEIDQPARRFGSLDELAESFPIGVDRDGLGYAQQLLLWSPKVMPAPAIKTINLKKPGGRKRQKVEGCGLFTLHLGGEHDGGLTESQLGYWTEAGARQRCSALPGPDTVDWAAHKILAGRLKYHVIKRVKAR